MRSLLYFGSKHCPPCKHFWNTYIKSQVADVYEDKVDFVVDDFNVAKKYHITQTPTLILMEDGQEIKRFVGCSEAYIGEIVDFLEKKDD